ALLGRFGLRPARPSSAIHRAWVGQIYFGDNPAKWVRFTSALTSTKLSPDNSLTLDAWATTYGKVRGPCEAWDCLFSEAL
ncbi:hypothetical protein, partial [Rubrivivax albus]|uniref:hypothetical protein n=1 Tax=Rubrivivax albus TaxID=2499835 RepID=UPI001E4AC57C